MGLDCSHNAFHGAYSAFNRLRQFVCRSTGGSFPPHYRYNDDGTILQDPKTGFLVVDEKPKKDWFYCGGNFTKEDWPGLFEFLEHSDCNGEISPEMCVLVADDLEKLLPEMEKIQWIASGHLEREGGYISVINQFIEGCRQAAENNEPLLFG